MPVTIDLPSAVERALKSKAEAAGLSTERYAQRVIERDLGMAEISSSESPQPLQTVANMILDRVRKLPREAFEGLPKDGASQHDHYIYGTPKRTS